MILIAEIKKDITLFSTCNEKPIVDIPIHRGYCSWHSKTLDSGHFLLFTFL